jgi:peptidoglycan/xylan/chitin deacetylase (PgdA/CDA1 family)
MIRGTLLVCTVAAASAALTGCGSSSDSHAASVPAASAATTTSADNGAIAAAPSASPAPAAAAAGGTPDGAASRAPNTMGRIPVVEYHVIADKNTLFERTREDFRKDLELLYERGYRPVNVSQILDKKFGLPAGMSPVAFVFDDASPSQFRYVEKNGQLEVDPTSALGIWLDFKKSHPDWDNRGTFCMLSGAEAGRSLFGNKGIEGQKDEWRFKKVQYLNQLGFELCNHTLWHATLSKFSDAMVQEQIARGQMAIDSAVPGYKVRTFALPKGVWPKNRALAYSGSWTDPKTGRVVTYKYDAVLEVAGGPNVSPFDPAFNPLSIDRVIVAGNALTRTLDQLDKSGTRYVSDGKH